MDMKHSTGNFDDVPRADDELERLAVNRVEREDTPRMPETPEEMIEATLDPVTGCVDQILAPLSRLGLAVGGLRDILLQINARLLAYLKSEKIVKKKKTLVPSAYACHVLSASSGLAPADEVLAIDDATAYIVAELNPLLHAAWKEYMAIAAGITNDQRTRHDIPKTIEEFFESFNIGRIGDQKVISFFGVLKDIASEDTDIALLDSKTAELPKEIVLTDPFGTEQKKYWLSRQRAYAALFHKDISLQELIHSKNTAVLYDFSQIADQTQDEDLKEAVQNIRSWLEGEGEQVKGMADDEFEQYIAGLHFAYGDPETLIELLNSLEIVKQKEPELYVRALGRSLRPWSQADAKSDLFGNLLQAAMYRSMHLSTGKGTEEYEALQSFLTGLTRMESRQDTIAPLSDEEFESMEKMFTDYVEQQKIEREEGEGSIVSLLVPGLLFGEKKRAYQMGKMLERVSAENREGLLNELRTATPNEFVRLMNSKRLLPKPLEWYENSAAGFEIPADALHVIEERGVHIRNGEEREIAIATLRSADTFSAVRTGVLNVGRLVISMVTPSTKEAVQYQARRVGRKKNLFEVEGENIRFALWKTTPSEKLLRGDEFFDYLKKSADTLTELQGKIEKGIKAYEARGFDIDRSTPIQDLGRQTIGEPVKDADIPSEDRVRLDPGDYGDEGGFDSTDFEDLKELDKDRNSALDSMLQILNSHPDITADQWQRWFKYFEAVGPGDHQMFSKSVRNVSTPLFQSIGSAEQILESPSQFWRIAEFIFPLDDKKIMGAMNTSSKDVYDFIIRNRSTLESRRGGSSSSFSEDELIKRGLSTNDELDVDQKAILENLKLFSKLFSPARCADMLDDYFMRSGNAPGVDFFCGILSQEDRKAFLVRLCQNALGVIRSALRERASQKIIDEGKIKLYHNRGNVNFIYILLRQCSRTIPENEEYLDLKNEVFKNGYTGDSEYRPDFKNNARRIRFDEEKKSWILEEAEQFFDPKGPSWQEVDRG